MILRELGDFVSLNQGLAINKKSEYLISEEKDDQFSLPLLRIADMVENKFSKYVSNKVNPKVIANLDDIIYTRTGQIGIAFRGYHGVVHNNSFIVTLTSNEINKDYLYVVLNSNFVRNQALNMAKNSVQPDLTHEMFKSIVIPVPPINEQIKLANFILDFDKKMENNKKSIDILQKIIKDTYKYWFIQFEFPDEYNKPYKSNGGAMKWNDFLEEDVPFSWKLVDLYDNSYFKIIKPGVKKFDKKIYIPTANVNNNDIVDGDFITFLNRENRANMQPDINTIWFARMKNSIKHIAITETDVSLVNNYIFSTGFLGLKCDKIIMSYLYSFIEYPYFEILKDRIAHGATQQSINNEDLKFVKLLCPDSIILRKFNDIVYPIIQRINKLRFENKKINEFKNYVLPLLIEGKLIL